MATASATPEIDEVKRFLAQKVGVSLNPALYFEDTGDGDYIPPARLKALVDNFLKSTNQSKSAQTRLSSPRSQQH